MIPYVMAIVFVMLVAAGILYGGLCAKGNPNNSEYYDKNLKGSGK